MKRVLFFPLFLIAVSASAEEGAFSPIHIPEEHEEVRDLLKDEEDEKRWWSITLGAFFRSQSVKRGAQLWPGPSASAGPSIRLFDVIQLRGPNITYSPFSRRSSHKIEASFQLFDDDEPFGAIGDHREDYRNQRPETWEAALKYSYGFGFRNQFKIGGKVVRDIDENEGLVGEAFFQLPLYKFTSFKYTFGVAESSQTTYLYGPEANSGPAYHRGEFTLVWPMVPWEGIILNRFEWSSILQGVNRQADFVRGKYEHVSLSFLVIWNVF